MARCAAPPAGMPIASSGIPSHAEGTEARGLSDDISFVSVTLLPRWGRAVR